MKSGIVNQPSNDIKRGRNKRDIKPNFEGFPKRNESFILFISKVFYAHESKRKSKKHGGIAHPHIALKIARRIAISYRKNQK
jgi:hypothetical protein